MQNNNPKTISFSDFLKRYEVNFKAQTGAEGLLAISNSGRAYLGYDKITNQKVAIKRTDMDKNLALNIQKCKALPPHPNVLQYLDSCYLETETGIVEIAIMPYFPLGSLQDIIQSKSLDYNKLDNLLHGVLQGIEHLHQTCRIPHGNLKLSNILVSEYKGSFTAVLTDYGHWDAENYHYKAPELIGETLTHTKNIDFWAFGVILFELLTGKLPFYSNEDYNQFPSNAVNQVLSKDLEEIFSGLESYPKKYKTLLRLCLERNPAKRTSSSNELLEILLPVSEEENTDIRPADYPTVLNSKPEIKKVKTNNNTGRILTIIGIALVIVYNIYRIYNPAPKPTYDESLKSDKQQVYIEDLGWTITIPEDFEKVSKQEMADLHERGKDAIESATKVEVEAPNLLFMYKNGNNIIESSYEIVDSDYQNHFLSNMEVANEILTKSMQSITPYDAKMDTTHLYKTIDNQEFYVFKFMFELGNNTKMSGYTYRKLINGKLLNIDIIYVNDEKGLQLIGAVRKSTFK